MPLPTPPTSSVSSESISPDHFVTIPELLFSLETITYVGFDHDTASAIWERWARWGNDGGREIDGGPITFASMFLEQIRSQANDTCSSLDSDWYETMAVLGISKELQDNMMDPRYKPIRLTQSLRYWLLDTLSMRYETLKEIQLASNERARTARRSETRPGGASTPHQQKHLASSGPTERARNISSSFYSAPGVSSATSSAAIVQQSPAGHLNLYKGGSHSRLHDIFDDDGSIRALSSLQSRPGDFNSTQMAAYFAVDLEVARKYAAWAKKRDTNGMAVILCVQIPNVLIESLTAEEKQLLYWPTEEWRSLVWNCRRGDLLPRTMTKYARSTLIIGTICGKPTSVIANLPSPGHIAETIIMKNSRDTRAVQYGFIGDAGLWLLKELGANAFALHPMTREEISDYERELGEIEEPGSE